MAWTAGRAVRCASDDTESRSLEEDGLEKVQAVVTMVRPREEKKDAEFRWSEAEAKFAPMADMISLYLCFLSLPLLSTLTLQLPLPLLLLP